jgi:site-specific recombinase XerD
LNFKRWRLAIYPWGKEQYIYPLPLGATVEAWHYNLVRSCLSMNTCRKPGYSLNPEGRNYSQVTCIILFIHWYRLQGINPSVTNALHIRGSVIINRLKQHNKRQVQYMAGHKYISSTEAYALQEMDTLQDELSKHHPFG